jgi:hypothetical protein
MKLRNAALALLPPVAAVGQMVSSSGSGTGSNFFGAATLSAQPFLRPVVTGARYSGQPGGEQVQTLLDGTHVKVAQRPFGGGDLEKPADPARRDFTQLAGVSIGRAAGLVSRPVSRQEPLGTKTIDVYWCKDPQHHDLRDRFSNQRSTIQRDDRDLVFA